MSESYSPGDRIYRWWYSYGDRADVQPLTVVRNNRVTVTVETDQGSRFRLRRDLVAGRLTPDIDPRNDR